MTTTTASWPRLALIAAVARDGGIGRGNDLLWREPADLKRFRQLTMGHPIIMGRRTWESLGRALPGRRNVVVTRDPAWQRDGAERAGSLDDALRLAAGLPLAFVIGGAQVFAAALPLVDALLLTEIDAEFDADTFFPDWPRDAFDLVSSEDHATAEGIRYRFASYHRRA